MNYCIPNSVRSSSKRIWFSLFIILLMAYSAVSNEEAYVESDGSISINCQNEYDECETWASSGECKKNPTFMLLRCSKACQMCGKSDEEVGSEILSSLEELKELKRQEEELRRNYGVIQATASVASQELFESMVDYMTNTVMVQDLFEPVRDLCSNKYRDCIEWANAGECDANPSFMNNHCAPACQSCHLFIYEIRCPWIPSNATNIWKNPGDLDTAFRRIVEDNQFSVQVLSQPPNGPWVLTVDNFLNDEECKGLIELGTERGYEKSMDLGAMKPDGTFSDYDSGERTSSNTWCLDECYTDERTKSVLARIEKLTGVPDAYQEYLQLLHYGEGQFYGRHHDYIPHHKDREEGVRIATVFLYLNDVDAGGGTNFPDVGNITVMPKKGMALIWPSVLNDDPNAIDERTDHQALPVEKGVKYGANAWLRNRNFKDPFSRGCA